MNDPHETRERLSVIPLGQRTYLNAKVRGDNSMSEKPRYIETIKMYARQDPDGMVKAKLLEPQWPICKLIRLDTMVDIQLSQMSINRNDAG
jgi:hypothetical protein